MAVTVAKTRVASLAGVSRGDAEWIAVGDARRQRRAEFDNTRRSALRPFRWATQRGEDRCPNTPTMTAATLSAPKPKELDMSSTLVRGEAATEIRKARTRREITHARAAAPLNPGSFATINGGFDKTSRCRRSKVTDEADHHRASTPVATLQGRTRCPKASTTPAGVFWAPRP